ncbi:GNAT family N-acetyltransferase [Gymnodinialimonas ulvae]|uniref:GNAT family N-acetyltransferase n=1 Tax=Gymnodinialimonas ulvae TaxID=3126504 RepID=UPI0030A9B250
MADVQLTIRHEAPEDHTAVHALTLAAFDGDAGLPELVENLRRAEAPFPTLSLVATYADNVPVGHAMLSHAWLDGPERLIDALILSPLAVEPDHQRRGIGTALIKAALTAADARGSPFVILEGSPTYYGARGFEPAGALGIRRPSLRIPERAFQVARLSAYNPSMTGTFVYKDVHWQGGVGLYR